MYLANVFYSDTLLLRSLDILTGDPIFIRSLDASAASDTWSWPTQARPDAVAHLPQGSGYFSAQSGYLSGYLSGNT